jgi:hypothetical protein
MLCALWAIANDKTLWTPHSRGQVRFMAVSLAAGHSWLLIGGLVLLGGVVAPSPFTYDMTIHAIVLGLALSMVFGHALLVLPSILGANLPFSPWLYLPLILLQTGVALRIIGGLTEWVEVRMLSGSITALAIATFAALVAGKMIKARFSPPSKVIQPVRG